MRYSRATAVALVMLIAVSAQAQQTDPQKLKDLLTGDAKGSASNNPQCKLFTPAEIASYVGMPVGPGATIDALKALQVARGLGLDRRIRMETPLMWIDKAATRQLAHQLGGERLVDIVLEETHTCYLGSRGERHAWGLYVAGRRMPSLRYGRAPNPSATSGCGSRISSCSPWTGRSARATPSARWPTAGRIRVGASACRCTS